ncbi:SusE domain-containing protein [Flavobacterium sp. RHBU_24]|uniref:SusE domain-containing protein n=1 Tax=Flavobacterium sp. RHBU_24 TaxID=3391185 RepID=UPI003984F036
MKNIFLYVFTVVLAAGFTSCEDEQDLLFVNPTGSFTITSPESGAAAVLTAATATNTALTVTWEDMDYETATEVNYVVQISADEAFTAPVDAATTTSTTASIVTSALNSIAVNAGIAYEMQGVLYVRVKATVGAQGAMETYSNTITFLVTPYEASIPVVDLYLVGNATDAGWNPDNNNTPLFRDAENQNLYHFTGYFAAGELKLLSLLGSWQPQYGSAGDGILAVNDGTGSDPAAIAVAAAGYYELTVNTEDMTYTLTPYDASAAPSFNSVGIIGEGTPGGWTADTVLTATATNPHIWHGTDIAITAAAVKFRANASWDLPGNWGGGTPISGMVTVNGGDFVPVVDAGNYDVWFNDLDGRYIFIAVN